MSHHALYRTSPKGQAFVGTCYSCGKENLKSFEGYCPGKLSFEECLVKAVNGD